MKLECPVIEDLLPLYIDDICSKESKIIVEKHMEECKSCRDKYEVQKHKIIVDDMIIKNLRSKKPFKKIKKYYLIKLILILMIIPVIYLSMIEIKGDGVGFSALYGRYKTERFLTQIEKGNFEAASRYGGYSGGIYNIIKDVNAAKEYWIDGMKTFDEEGIEFISHRDNDIKTDDGFTSGHVIISVKYKDTIYDFILFISTNTGKVEMGGIIPYHKYQFNDPTEIEKMLMEKISKIITTYNPG